MYVIITRSRSSEKKKELGAVAASSFDGVAVGEKT